MSVVWMAESRTDQGLLARIGRAGDRVVAEWVGMARLDVARDGSDVRFTSEPGASPETVEKIRRGTAALLVRHLRGHLGLHASAVQHEGAAIAFVGASGQGKSTLAAYACSDHGAALIADDALAVEREGGSERWLAVPLEREHWLERDACEALGFEVGAAEQKASRLAVRAAEQPAVLSAIVLLDFANRAQPELLRLTPVEALAALVPMVLRFIVDEPAAQRLELDALASLLEHVPIVRLERPRGLVYLPDAFEAVVSYLAEGSP
jgi:hypothetical protein